MEKKSFIIYRTVIVGKAGGDKQIITKHICCEKFS